MDCVVTLRYAVCRSTVCIFPVGWVFLFPLHAFLFSFQSESVDLALQILDGYSLRGHTLSVQKAEFKMKGEFDASKKKKKLTNKEKKRMKEQQEKLVTVLHHL